MWDFFDLLRWKMEHFVFPEKFIINLSVFWFARLTTMMEEPGVFSVCPIKSMRSINPLKLFNETILNVSAEFSEFSDNIIL